MSDTLEKIYKIGKVVEKNFYPKNGKKGRIQKIKGLFADVGRKIKKEGKTSVDLVRDLRKSL